MTRGRDVNKRLSRGENISFKQTSRGSKLMNMIVVLEISTFIRWPTLTQHDIFIKCTFLVYDMYFNIF
jgi:hypothetical protein